MLFDKLRSNRGCYGLRENQRDKEAFCCRARHSGATDEASDRDG
jgi:hypothetical protein